VSNNPCKTVSCIENECIYNNTEGECDDNDPCTGGDYCENGICVAGEYVCSSKEECEEEWECRQWGECINGIQTRICECSCEGLECEGDNTTERECSVNLRVGTPQDIGEQVAQAVADFGDFVAEEPVRFTLLLVLVIGLVSFFVVKKFKAKGKIEKL
jgi:hypothetical protein